MTLTPALLRAFLRDYAVENERIEVEEFSDGYLSAAIQRAVDEWNATLPALTTSYTTTLPSAYLAAWRRGAAAEALNMQAMWLKRNEFNYEAGGVTVKELEGKAEWYSTLGSKWWSEYQAWLRETKFKLALAEFQTLNTTAAQTRAVNEWNLTSPQLQTLYEYDTFSADQKAIVDQGAKGWLLRLQSIWAKEIELQYQSSGASVQALAGKSEFDAQMSERLWEDYRGWLLREKIGLAIAEFQDLHEEEALQRAVDQWNATNPPGDVYTLETLPDLYLPIFEEGAKAYLLRLQALWMKALSMNMKDLEARAEFDLQQSEARWEEFKEWLREEKFKHSMDTSYFYGP